MQVERWTGRVIDGPLEDVYVYEAPVRIWHWVTVLCFMVLGVTGYLIGAPPPAIGGEATDSFMFGWIRTVHFSTAFILIAAEMGLPALATAVTLLLALALAAARVHLFRRHRVDRTVALAFLGSWAGLIVSCMLGSRFSDESLISYFWILGALVAVVRRLPEPGRLRRHGA